MGSFTATFASSGGGNPQQRVITSSGTFVTPVQGKYRITLVGCGSGAQNNIQAGSSGAICQSVVTLAAGVTLTITLGARGTGGATPTAGGSSTISATGLTTMTCTAGSPSSPGTASGGTEFNRAGVAGAVGASLGGSSVALYGIGYAATGQGGAGVGEAACENQSLYNYFGGAAIKGATKDGGFLNGRFLQPAGIGGNSSGTVNECIGGPGAGGGYAGAIGYAGGVFAGGSGSTGAANGGRGGAFGGGGGSTAGSAYTGGHGGSSGAVIEWVEG